MKYYDKTMRLMSYFSVKNGVFDYSCNYQVIR